jgi:hypothetical protein
MSITFCIQHRKGKKVKLYSLQKEREVREWRAKCAALEQEIRELGEYKRIFGKLEP